MKGRGSKASSSADLLVCFPSRAYLTLMPKPICSPARTSELVTNQHPPHHRRQPSHLRKSSVGGHASHVLWANANKPNNNCDTYEPTSPKVTCAGQVKVRPKPNNPCKSWQSVMGQIEQLHKKQKAKKSSAWIGALGLRTDLAQFLTCLRNLRLDFRCFGSFPSGEMSSDDEDCAENGDGMSSEAIFAKRFMNLPENDGKENNDGKGKTVRTCLDDGEGSAARPPPNALLLMRSRSTPARSWVEEFVENEQLMVMGRGAQLSAEVVQETWVVGGWRNDMLSRSRSSRR